MRGSVPAILARKALLYVRVAVDEEVEARAVGPQADAVNGVEAGGGEAVDEVPDLGCGATTAPSLVLVQHEGAAGGSEREEFVEQHALRAHPRACARQAVVGVEQHEVGAAHRGDYLARP